MTWYCTVRGCARPFSQGPDHLPEPCPDCWKEGWRTDAFGNTYRIQPQEPANA